MRRGPSLRRLGLIVVFAGLSVLFLWDSARGQGFRGRAPGMPGMPNTPRPPIGGGGGIGGGGVEFVYTCTKCGKEVGRGKTGLDGPASCPFCGVRFINGGFGGGSPARPPAGGNPAIPPSNLNPPPQNPAPFVPPQQPVAPAQPPMSPQAPPAQPPLSGDATSSSASATVAAPSGGSKWLIPGIIALVVLGLLGVGGVWMIIASMNKDEPAPRRSKTRSRRRRDDDDDD